MDIRDVRPANPGFIDFSIGSKMAPNFEHCPMCAPGHKQLTRLIGMNRVKKRTQTVQFEDEVLESGSSPDGDESRSPMRHRKRSQSLPVNRLNLQKFILVNREKSQRIRSVIFLIERPICLYFSLKSTLGWAHSQRQNLTTGVKF